MGSSKLVTGSVRCFTFLQLKNTIKMSVQNFSGLGDSSRNSSKVIAPPGGRTSISLFGGSDPEPAPAPRKQQPQSSNIFGPADPSPAPKPRNNETSHDNIFGDAPSRPSPSKPQQRAANPIAPESQAPGGGRSSTKVMAPPGGKTSI